MSLRGPNGRGNLLHLKSKALITFEIGFDQSGNSTPTSSGLTELALIGFELALFFRSPKPENSS